MRERLRLSVSGAVQGVGFRPFVHRLATELVLDGWVRNSASGVLIEVDGERNELETFRARIATERPPRAVIQGLEASWLDPAGHKEFEILDSVHDGTISALVLPDIATCEDCKREIADRANRRYRYPFTNCTNCGPRLSIIEALPYDRALTSMKRFQMCPACQREYNDPRDRRFHAQPNACPACGPQLALWNGTGQVLAEKDDALRATADAIRAGRIVAVKGLGGFHLVVDAQNDEAVHRLRVRKHREEKPFALMYPGIDVIDRDCAIDTAERRLLISPESPIVLLTRHHNEQTNLAASVAPGNPNLGVMLPYTPLHILLTQEVAGPVVATSGNLSDEPICTDEHGAIVRLGSIADLFLVHDRPIVRHVDDSIVRVMLDRELVLRRARGYAPLPIPLRQPGPTVLGVGAHLKNTVALASGSNVFVSQHIGDLESAEANEAFTRVIADFQSLFEATPAAVVADLHPDYRSTRHARSLGLPVTQVQHHFAHVAACMAENDLEGPVLGVSWDGTGYGPDGTVWGGEFLRVEGASHSRVACLRPFRLPGGDRAVKEPRRSALGLLHAIAGADAFQIPSPSVAAFSRVERAPLLGALARGVNSPVTTSAGRLFDAVASLMGLRQQASFEGQAAMDLEFAIASGVDETYPFATSQSGDEFALGTWLAPSLILDWAPTVRAVIDDVRAGVGSGVVAARFHNTLAEMIVGVALYVNEPRVLLTGGCFQNRYLTERTVNRLRQAGFRPYWHQRIPPNDGGISLGQVAAYVRSQQASQPDSANREDSSSLALR